MDNSERDRIIREIHQTLIGVAQKLSIACDTVARHDRSLYGNGRPGICTRIDQVETTQKQCPAREARRPANTIALGALVISVLGVIWTILRR